MLATAQVPLRTAITAFDFYHSLRKKRDARPFFSLGLFLMRFAGIGMSMCPYVIPRSVTILDAAASQGFTLIGAGVLIPVILAYTAWCYWVFRGKVGADGYH